MLVDLLEYPSEQAASILGVRASTVRSLATQARQALRATEGCEMPDVNQLFRAATQHVRPATGALGRQLERQRRQARNRKMSALAVSGDHRGRDRIVRRERAESQQGRIGAGSSGQ